MFCTFAALGRQFSIFTSTHVLAGTVMAPSPRRRPCPRDSSTGQLSTLILVIRGSLGGKIHTRSDQFT
ncbi:hypothetical protein GN956_G16517 [Arapaima gigas]